MLTAKQWLRHRPPEVVNFEVSGAASSTPHTTAPAAVKAWTDVVAQIQEPDAPAPFLSGIWNSRLSPDKQAAPILQQAQAVNDASAEQVACAVCQLWGCMVRWGTEFGLITCGKWWYVARRDGSDMLIGDLPWRQDSAEDDDEDEPTSDPDDLPFATKLSTTPGGMAPTCCCLIGIHIGLHARGLDTSSIIRVLRNGERAGHTNGTASASAQRALLRDVASETLHLKRHAMAYGASGSTVQGRIGKTSVAVKLAPFASAQGQGLLRKAGALPQLQPLWDHHVVALVDFGTTVDGDRNPARQAQEVVQMEQLFGS
ncbi:hypothetical protein WJX72_006699 [[Myrmecia] bisecta]|uniref:Uncharacterized protein n=1 Tax=[Myrmecia] bisecta TaxID=41462 RepID=A0AAW1QSB7_9CHLO